MENLIGLLGPTLLNTIVFWIVNLVMAAVVAGGVLALYRTARRVADDLAPSPSRPKLEHIQEVKVLAVGTSWLEAYATSQFSRDWPRLG